MAARHCVPQDYSMLKQQKAARLLLIRLAYAGMVMAEESWNSSSKLLARPDAISNQSLNRGA
jgi:hypothetical protein